MARQDEPEITDLTRGVYRRIYAAFLKGRRINVVSLEAEAWFWRVHAVADDFGNADGDSRLCRDATAGRREVTTEQVAKWIEELVVAGLLNRYESAGDVYVHITGFVTWQPAGKNGKRVRRYPASPWDESLLSGDPEVNPGESGGIQKNRRRSSASDSDSDTDTEKEDSTEPPKAASVAPADLKFPVFPTIGRAHEPKQWALDADYVSELTETFKGINVSAECRKAHGWIKSNPSRRKHASGMRKFLFDWMNRTNNRVQPGHRDVKAVASSAEWKDSPWSPG